MGAPDLLQHLHGAGLTVTLSEGGGIKVSPAGILTDAQRQAIREHKPELIALLTLRAGTSAALVNAINQCCNARGDDDANRAALIAECSALDAAGQADMLAHFNAEAERWERACRGGRP